MRSLSPRAAAVAALTGAICAAGSLAAGGGTALGAAPARSAAACAVDYTTNDWGTEFTATVTITNRGPSVNGWTLTYSYTGNQRLTGGWNGRWTQSGTSVTVTGESWNAALAAGASVQAGAQFTSSGTNAAPTGFALNGTACDGELEVSGNRFVNADGTAVRLRGVNRSGGEFACVQGNGIWDGPMDAASVAAIRGWNANAVRVPLNADCWLGLGNVDPAYRGAAYQNAVENYVGLLEGNGITPILELHWSHGLWTGYDGHCQTAAAICQKPMPDAQYAPEFWRQVATAYGAGLRDHLRSPIPDPTAQAHPNQMEESG
ncbi:cellulase family glycosylhydrolase [Actinomadura sp. DSM 109109]|nr:cellulase family glycosylhydrolase [Actinomadura lepetitiana]